MLDREYLVEVVSQGPDPMFATVSGAHLYGFASPDSDVDLRGAFMRPAEEMLGLVSPKETITIMRQEPVDLDWVAHDLCKFARFMTRHNGYALEQLYSPLVVMTTSNHEILKELGRGCITRPIAHHYRGFARSRRRRLAEANPTIKHLLYAYRVLLTGIHMMRSGEIVANIQNLNVLFQLPVIDELVARKREGAEAMRVEEGELQAHGSMLDRLEAELQEAYDSSPLPDGATTFDQLNAFVVQARLERVRQGGA